MRQLGDFGEARFVLAALVLVAAIGALFVRIVDQGHFVDLVGIVLTLYSAHSVADDKLRDRKGDTPP